MPFHKNLVILDCPPPITAKVWELYRDHHWPREGTKAISCSLSTAARRLEATRKATTAVKARRAEATRAQEAM